MFYSTQVLARRTPLGIVWIAAHMDRQLKRHQIFEASITVAVDELLDPGTAAMALRLSGQLLLGVVRIYFKKCSYLHADCKKALDELLHAFQAEVVLKQQQLPAGRSGKRSARAEAITMPDLFDELEGLGGDALAVLTVPFEGHLPVQLPAFSSSQSRRLTLPGSQSQLQQQASSSHGLHLFDFEDETFQDTGLGIPHDIDDIELERLRDAPSSAAAARLRQQDLLAGLGGAAGGPFEGPFARTLPLSSAAGQQRSKDGSPGGSAVEREDEGAVPALSGQRSTAAGAGLLFTPGSSIGARSLADILPEDLLMEGGLGSAGPARRTGSEAAGGTGHVQRAAAAAEVPVLSPGSAGAAGMAAGDVLEVGGRGAGEAAPDVQPEGGAEVLGEPGLPPQHAGVQHELTGQPAGPLGQHASAGPDLAERFEEDAAAAVAALAAAATGSAAAATAAGRPPRAKAARQRTQQAWRPVLDVDGRNRAATTLPSGETRALLQDRSALMTERGPAQLRERKRRRLGAASWEHHPAVIAGPFGGWRGSGGADPGDDEDAREEADAAGGAGGAKAAAAALDRSLARLFTRQPRHAAPEIQALSRGIVARVDMVQTFLACSAAAAGLPYTAPAGSGGAAAAAATATPRPSGSWGRATATGGRMQQLGTPEHGRTLMDPTEDVGGAEPMVGVTRLFQSPAGQPQPTPQQDEGMDLDVLPAHGDPLQRDEGPHVATAIVGALPLPASPGGTGESPPASGVRHVEQGPGAAGDLGTGPTQRSRMFGLESGERARQRTSPDTRGSDDAARQGALASPGEAHRRPSPLEGSGLRLGTPSSDRSTPDASFTTRTHEVLGLLQTATASAAAAAAAAAAAMAQAGAALLQAPENVLQPSQRANLDPAGAIAQEGAVYVAAGAVAGQPMTLALATTPPPAISLKQMTQGSSRLDAARCFYEVLVLQTKGIVELRQPVPLGDVQVRLTNPQRAAAFPLPSHQQRQQQGTPQPARTPAAQRASSTVRVTGGAATPPPADASRAEGVAVAARSPAPQATPGPSTSSHPGQRGHQLSSATHEEQRASGMHEQAGQTRSTLESSPAALGALSRSAQRSGERSRGPGIAQARGSPASPVVDIRVGRRLRSQQG